MGKRVRRYALYLATALDLSPAPVNAVSSVRLRSRTDRSKTVNEDLNRAFADISKAVNQTMHDLKAAQKDRSGF